MKKIDIQPFSALAGAGAAVLVMTALEAQSQYTPSAPTTLEVPTVVEHVVTVNGIPSPEQLWSFRGEPVESMSAGEQRVLFTVPSDKMLVLTHGQAPGSTGGVNILMEADGRSLQPKVELPVSDDWSQAGLANGFRFGPASQIVIESNHPQVVSPGVYKLKGYLVET